MNGLDRVFSHFRFQPDVLGNAVIDVDVAFFGSEVKVDQIHMHVEAGYADSGATFIVHQVGVYALGLALRVAQVVQLHDEEVAQFSKARHS